MKRKFGDSVRNKTPTATKNEVLAKRASRNISQVIHLMYELGIEPKYGSEQADDSKMILKVPL